jgi:hypothetical protein
VIDVSDRGRGSRTFAEIVDCMNISAPCAVPSMNAATASRVAISLEISTPAIAVAVFHDSPWSSTHDVVSGMPESRLVVRCRRIVRSPTLTSSTGPIVTVSSIGSPKLKSCCITRNTEPSFSPVASMRFFSSSGPGMSSGHSTVNSRFAPEPSTEQTNSSSTATPW